MQDVRGLPITAAAPEAAAALDRAVDAYLHFGRDTGSYLKAALEADPELVMAHCLKGYFFHLMGMRALVPRAQKALADAEAHVMHATPREQRHVAALRAWCRGDLVAATREWEAVLEEHPRDILALKMPHYTLFYTGQSAALRRSVERVLPAWDEGVPGYGYVLGMHAFGLEETGEYGGAERAGREAVERNPRDGWAIHAVAHVMEMQDRSHEGIAWIQGLEPYWNQANNFRYHLWWHRAIMHFDLAEYDDAVALYDAEMFDESSEDYLDLSNDASLLMRLEFAGVDVGDRWSALAEKARRRVDDHILGFADAHFAMALAGAHDLEATDRLIESMRRFAREHSEDTESAVLEDVALPVCEAIRAYRADEFSSAADRLADVRKRVIHLGGSHAQRDVFELLLIDAALKGERLEMARDLLRERLAANPRNPWSWECYARALDPVDEAAARDARQRASDHRRADT